MLKSWMGVAQIWINCNIFWTALFISLMWNVIFKIATSLNYNDLSRYWIKACYIDATLLNKNKIASKCNIKKPWYRWRAVTSNYNSDQQVEQDIGKQTRFYYDFKRET